LRASGSTSARWLDGRTVAADDATVIEFATVTALLGVLTTSLSGLQARVLQRLSGSNAVAVQQVVVSAKAENVASAAARGAYARAPYKQPALRYVYATAWVAGTKDRTSCTLAKIDVGGTRDLAVKALRQSPPTMRRLQLTAVQAATAFANGFVSAC
jgi:hypothetical protein